jgi:anthraniloyl-CoA monooxygenase
MELNSIDILGGGPGGLFAARLLKRRNPDAIVTVHEQSEPGKTFGFGVGLAERTQRNLHAADPEAMTAIADASFSSKGLTLTINERSATLSDASGIAIARNALLDVLRELATTVGVNVRFGERKSVEDLDGQLIIASDGVSSATRNTHAGQFGESIETGRGLYLWCGTDFALPATLFAPITTEHGTFVTHAYPYAPGRSTFLIETDPETWRRAGFDTPDTETDEQSLRYLESAFKRELQGHQLIGNRTRWNQFRTITCDSWHHENVVLIGDAAHTAHYSIGSGTKLAMEDAIALDASLAAASDLEHGFAGYEALRRPSVESLQAAANRSQRWWDSFPTRMDLPMTILTSFMTRTGRISLERLQNDVPELAATMTSHGKQASPEGPVDDTRADVVDIVLSSPVNVLDMTFAHREVTASDLSQCEVVDLEICFDDAWGDEADAALSKTSGTSGSRLAYRLTGSAARETVLTRLEFAERLMLQASDSVVIVEATSASRADLAAGIASGRTHLVVINDDNKVAA